MISTSPLFPAVAASVCAPRDTHAHTRERHTHAFILYMMCICTHVSFSSLISLLISGARKTAAAHSRLEMRCILSHVRPTLYFACESCLRLHRRRLAKVNLRLIPVLIISLPATKTLPPPPSARSSFSLALCADDKMCPRGFETFSLRERELETVPPPCCRTQSTRQQKCCEQLRRWQFPTSRPAKLLIKNTHRTAVLHVPRLVNVRAVREELRSAWDENTNAACSSRAKGCYTYYLQLLC